MEPGVDDLEPRSRSVGAGLHTGTQSCASYLDTLLLLWKTWKFKVDNDTNWSSTCSVTIFVNTEAW